MIFEPLDVVVVPFPFTDQLRHDPLMALVSDQGNRGDSPPLAGKNPLSRLEHAPTQGPGRYHKIDHDPDALQALLVERFIQAHPQPQRKRGSTFGSRST